MGKAVRKKHFQNGRAFALAAQALAHAERLLGDATHRIGTAAASDFAARILGEVQELADETHDLMLELSEARDKADGY